MLLGGIHVIKLLMTFLLLICLSYYRGVTSQVVQRHRNCPSVQETQKLRFDSLVGKIPWSRKWLPTPVLLPGKFHGQRSLAGYSPWGHKESNMT